MRLIPRDVDAYIARADPAYRGKLREMRRAIRQVAPNAVERISYGMPYYAYQGRLAWFAAMKNYIGFYLPPPTIEEHAHDLTAYVTTKSAIHLPLSEKLPIDLIKRLVRARMNMNEKGK